jgi:hypothetical protein
MPAPVALLAQLIELLLICPFSTGGMGEWAQYPGEKEITFPPFTCLESHGDPRLEQTKEGELIIFPLKAPAHLPVYLIYPTLLQN